MKDDVLRKLLKEGTDSVGLPDETIIVTTTDTNSTDQLYACATAVMSAYQNANKWLDSIKEILLMEQGCVFFSTYVHNLAHTMPMRFDKFGDILHTADIEVPYPATEALVVRPSDIPSAFTQIFNILDTICSELLNFIKITQDTSNHAMACSAEELLIDIKGEYPHLYRMRKAYSLCENLINFDKYVNHYMNDKDKLLG